LSEYFNDDFLQAYIGALVHEETRKLLFIAIVELCLQLFAVL